MFQFQFQLGAICTAQMRDLQLLVTGGRGRLFMALRARVHGANGRILVGLVARGEALWALVVVCDVILGLLVPRRLVASAPRIIQVWVHNLA